MSAKTRLGARLEGATLLAMAGFLTWLIIGGHYWMLLNPRFQWLHGVTAILLTGCGLAALFTATRGFSIVRLAPMIVLLGLFGIAGVSLHEAGQAAKKTGSENVGGSMSPPRTLTFEAPVQAESPYLELDGVKYTRISPPELFNLVERTPEAALQGRWVLRGLLAKMPDASETTGYTLLRPFIYCCLADGVAVGFHITPTPGMSFPDREWVAVCGRLEQADKPFTAPSEQLLAGAFFTALEKDYLLVVESVEGIEAPPMPYIFNLKMEPPFTW